MQENIKNIVLCGDQEEIFEHAFNWVKRLAQKSLAIVHYVHDGHHSSNLEKVNQAINSGIFKGETHLVSANKPAEIARHMNLIGPELIVCSSHKGKAHSHFGYSLAKLSEIPVMCIENAIPETANKLIVVMENDPEARQKLGISWLISKTLGLRPYIFGTSKHKDAETNNYVNVYMDQATLYMNTRGMTVDEGMELGVNIADTCLKYADDQNAIGIAMMTTSENVGFLKGTATEQLFPISNHAILLVPNKHVEGTGGGGY